MSWTDIANLGPITGPIPNNLINNIMLLVLWSMHNMWRVQYHEPQQTEIHVFKYTTIELYYEKK